MPSKSYVQHRLMEAAYHDPKVAKARGITKEVAKDFIDADEKANIWQVKPTKKNPMGKKEVT